MAINKTCETCKGEGWICENHMDTPWGTAPGQCDCGAGKNCLCNPNGDVEWQHCYASTNAEEITPTH